MDYFENLQLIKNLAHELIKPRSYSYSEEMVAEYLKEYKHITLSKLRIVNKNNENIKTSLFVNGTQPQQICILFMHGLGSTRLEGLNLLKELPTGYSLCLFDFSGSGKSEGQLVTYGNKQKQDIEAVLGALRKSNYKKFVLWGRSMGAVSALLHSVVYRAEDVVLLVLDSPFSSFESITKQLAQKKVNVPTFMINVLLDLIKANFKKMEYDPFQIDVATSCSENRIPCLFIYSENDDVVNHSHSLKIISNIKAKYDKIIIKESHNAPRNRETLKNIYNTIQNYRYSALLERKRRSIFEDDGRKSRGINVVSRQKNNHKIIDSNHKKQSSVRRTIDRTIDRTIEHDENQQYFVVGRKKVVSPAKRIHSFYYDVNEDIAMNINEKMRKKMLNNQRYL